MGRMLILLCESPFQNEIVDLVLDNIDLLDVDGLVDLLFSGKTIINL